MKEYTPELLVFCGGRSREREVSLVSGRSVYEQLKELNYPARLIILEDDALPLELDPGKQVVVPMLHGRFGEDGELQKLLESAGFNYVGCDSAASRLCMNKIESKQVAASAGLPVLIQATIGANGIQGLDAILAASEEWVVKPVGEGSSVDLLMVSGADELNDCLRGLSAGEWMVEPRLRGHDLTIGVLNGKALGAVEIFPQGGVYDYRHKYQPGSTQYRFPAEIGDRLTRQLETWAEAVFSASGCRDFARIDFFLDSSGNPFFLELNTLPGMTPTSLLPKSARVCGYGYGDLVEAMIAPALTRWKKRQLQPEQP